MDRLHQELTALPGLEQLSASQLRDLPWRTKEQVLLALFREQVSSTAVAEQLQAKSRDRKLERKADKVLELDRSGVRKKEESFRADFMQLAAAELARLGAPALISWQKLVFDNECCAQAFRLLLTRIKSSRRSAASGVSTNSSSLLAARYGAGSRQGSGSDNNALGGDQRRDWDGESNVEGRDQSTRFPPLKQTPGPLRRTSSTRRRGDNSSSSVKSGELKWNSDTTVQVVPQEDESDDIETRGTGESKSTRTTSRHPGAGISIERTLPVNQPSHFAAKFKKNQIQAVQEENTVLTSENAKLREEISQLEALNAVLQNDNTNNNSLGDDRPASLEFAQRRMRLLQAQNLQLQRQVRLLQDAMLAHENAETNLMSALNHWRDVINSGREEAKAAGADQNGATTSEEKDRSPIKWMLAVPDNLLNELKHVEGQIQAAANAANSCLETKLRVSKLSASFRRDEDASLKLSEIYGREPSGLAHLKIERVKQLENALASVAAELNQLSMHVLQRFPPKVSTIDQAHSSAYKLGKSVRELVLELGAFGVVVPISSVPSSRSSDGEWITALDVIKALSSASGVARGPAGVKEREKQAKVMLKQLHAKYSAIENDVAACQREAAYWRTAWNTQDDILRRLVKRVRHLGQKKVEWCQHYLLAPMINIAEVFASFRQAYDENTTRQNPYLPLLVETLSMEHPMLEDALQQWQEYSTTAQLKMDELVADYEANCLVLASASAGHLSHQTIPYNEHGEDTLTSFSEQVPVH